MRLFEGTEFDIPPRCERCNELETDCRCEPVSKLKQPPNEQTAIVLLQKRKRGKTVTVVQGLASQNTDLAVLTTTLKNHCGAGGTVKQDKLSRSEVIEIQGDQLEKVINKLTDIGFTVKRR